MLRHSFLHTKPYAYRKPPMLIQKHYDVLYNDLELNSSEDRDVRYLYLLYMHALITRKWFVLAGDVEPRVLDRVKAYLKVLDEYKVDLRFSDGSERHARCRLKQSDPRDAVKRAVQEMYADAKVEVMFEGGMKVYGIDMDRAKNLSFLDYDSLYDGEHLWYQKIDFSLKFKQLKPLEGAKSLIDETAKSVGLMKKSVEDLQAELNERISKSGIFVKDDSRFILISQHRVSSDLFLEHRINGQWEGLRDHIIRTEKCGVKGDTLDFLKLRPPQLCDFDGFLAGNPYPQMYIK